MKARRCRTCLNAGTSHDPLVPKRLPKRLFHIVNLIDRMIWKAERQRELGGRREHDARAA